MKCRSNKVVQSMKHGLISQRKNTNCTTVCGRNDGVTTSYYIIFDTPVAEILAISSEQFIAFFRDMTETPPNLVCFAHPKSDSTKTFIEEQ